MEIEQMEANHCLRVIDLINYYVENTGFTFIEKSIPYRLFEPLKASLGRELSLVACEKNDVFGAVMFKRYSSMSYFKGVVEMGIYVHKDYHRRGIGKMMFEESVSLLKKQGNRIICSTVSSLNENSIAFHKAVGFREMGCYKNIGIYNETPFSVIHFQYEL